jgi:hypothetical protein
MLLTVELLLGNAAARRWSCWWSHPPLIKAHDLGHVPVLAAKDRDLLLCIVIG